MIKLNLDDYLTTAEAATELAARTATVQKYCQRRLIPAIKAGKTWLISRQDVAQFAAQRRKPGRPKA